MCDSHSSLAQLTSLEHLTFTYASLLNLRGCLPELAKLPRLRVLEIGDLTSDFERPSTTFEQIAHLNLERLKLGFSVDFFNGLDSSDMAALRMLANSSITDLDLNYQNTHTCASHITFLLSRPNRLIRLRYHVRSTVIYDNLERQWALDYFETVTPSSPVPNPWDSLSALDVTNLSRMTNLVSLDTKVSLGRLTIEALSPWSRLT